MPDELEQSWELLLVQYQGTKSAALSSLWLKFVEDMKIHFNFLDHVRNSYTEK